MSNNNAQYFKSKLFKPSVLLVIFVLAVLNLVSTRFLVFDYLLTVLFITSSVVFFRIVDDHFDAWIDLQRDPGKLVLQLNPVQLVLATLPWYLLALLCLILSSRQFGLSLFTGYSVLLLAWYRFIKNKQVKRFADYFIPLTKYPMIYLSTLPLVTISDTTVTERAILPYIFIVICLYELKDDKTIALDFPKARKLLWNALLLASIVIAAGLYLKG